MESMREALLKAWDDSEMFFGLIVENGNREKDIQKSADTLVGLNKDLHREVVSRLSKVSKDNPRTYMIARLVFAEALPNLHVEPDVLLECLLRFQKDGGGIPGQRVEEFCRLQPGCGLRLLNLIIAVPAESSQFFTSIARGLSLNDFDKVFSLTTEQARLTHGPLRREALFALSLLSYQPHEQELAATIKL